MNIGNLRKKTIKELNINLLELRKKIFKLKLEKTSGTSFNNGNLLRRYKKSVALILTVIKEMSL